MTNFHFHEFFSFIELLAASAGVIFVSNLVPICEFFSVYLNLLDLDNRRDDWVIRPNLYPYCYWYCCLFYIHCFIFLLIYKFIKLIQTFIKKKLYMHAFIFILQIIKWFFKICILHSFFKLLEMKMNAKFLSTILRT